MKTNEDKGEQIMDFFENNVNMQYFQCDYMEGAHPEIIKNTITGIYFLLNILFLLRISI